MSVASTHSLSLFLPTEEETAKLGEVMAGLMRPGMTLLLEGPIGAGKTHLARAFIRSRLRRMEDVPSPTFTLVQVYEAPDADIWHADLYRLTHPDEVHELGLEAAFDNAVCLVEWPDRLGKHVPKDALHLELQPHRDGRMAILANSDANAGLLDAVAGIWRDAVVER
jgi:tRNA threonylcarbamoyladenosine biosynthesis protein TsaE